MENKLEELNKILKIIQSRNELLTEEIKRNEESIKSIENEISIILDGTIDSSMESKRANDFLPDSIKHTAILFKTSNYEKKKYCKKVIDKMFGDEKM